MLKKMSNTKKLADSIANLCKAYKELPYITIKRYSKFYILPHKPTKPAMIFHLKASVKAIKQQSSKYKQYYNPQQLSQNSVHKYQQELLKHGQQKQIALKQHQQRAAQYKKKKNEYFIKYLEPLFHLMRTTSYQEFKKEKVKTLREQREKTKKLQSENSQGIDKVKNNQDDIKGRKKQLSFLYQIHKLKLAAKWKSMTLQEKQPYEEMALKRKQLNQSRINQFIQNHQVPFARRFSTIGRFITKYSSIYNLTLKNKQLYVKYKEIGQSEKNEFKKQCIQMNLESRQKYQNFLKKWNITEEQLKNIIEISQQFKKHRKQLFKRYKKHPQERDDESQDLQLDEAVKQ